MSCIWRVVDVDVDGGKIDVGSRFLRRSLPTDIVVELVESLDVWANCIGTVGIWVDLLQMKFSTKSEVK